jgi:RNA polymerase sigma-70 factor (ECF subfamily)
MTDANDTGEALELRIRTLCQSQDFRVAASELLRALGPDVARFIHARFQDEDQSAEVFARFAEDLWLGLPKLRFECSLRAWLFILARNAGHRYLARDLRKHKAWVPLSQAPEIALYAAEIRSTALSSFTTPRAQRMAQLRAELSLEDQELLTLRIDREFEFAEIARITLGSPNPDAARVARESARLRKRFQALKERLRARWAELQPKE